MTGPNQAGSNSVLSDKHFFPFFFYRLNHFAKYGKMFPKIMENVNLIFVKVINIIKLGISQLPDLSAA